MGMGWRRTAWGGALPANHRFHFSLVNNPARHPRRRSASWVRIALGLAATWATVVAAPFTKGPYLQAPGPTSMVVVWESQNGGPGGLRFGRGDRLDHTISPVAPVTVQSGADTFQVYQVRLSGLEPGTTYGYVAEIGTVRSPRAHFHTFDPAAKSVTFIAYGDSRTNPAVHRRLAAQFLGYHPDVILHTGDLVARGRDYGRWSTECFDPLADVINEVPLLPAIGNHEGHGENYRAYFHPPGASAFFYSCDVGPVHIVSLDYRNEQGADAQFAWVAADLMASTARWKVVILHYPMFNLGGHAELWGHEHYLPLFRSAKVDLVIGGHSHLYERFRPLVPRAEPDAWAIQYITTGGGGAPLMTPARDASLAASLKAYHFVVFDATADALTGRCIDENGRVLDRFTIAKEPDGRQSTAYRRNAYAEEAVTAAAHRLAGRKREAEAAVPPGANKGWQQRR